ncbi:hypothetical protein Taro_002731 [Colocasia esculenta]|uniref:Uncharacterized protein n=1 Tax=Colocasia esculenta TaxID=4460 RepID=A0A843TDI5_COLES|nr:hypothetical protein [Colocasia esculenta]
MEVTSDCKEHKITNGPGYLYPIRVHIQIRLLRSDRSLLEDAKTSSPMAHPRSERRPRVVPAPHGPPEVDIARKTTIKDATTSSPAPDRASFALYG